VTKDEIIARLRPHQRPLVAGLSEILRRSGTGVDLSDPGAGKTYVSAAVASLSRLPTLVVCPKIARSNWEKAARLFGDSFSVIGYEMLRTGRTLFGRWTDHKKGYNYFVCENCQQKVDPENPHPCYCHPQGIHCLNTKTKKASYGQFVFHSAIKNIIFDEVHRCGAQDSLNADMLIAAKRQKIRTTGLSATMACNPLNMRALGYLLDLHNLDTDLLGKTPIGNRIERPNFYRWVRHYGCQKDPAFHGWTWLVSRDQQLQTMMDIRSLIIPERGVRIAWQDIPGFPERQILAELYDLDAPEAVDSCYKEMAASLAQLEEKKLTDKAPDLKLTIMLRARQQVELLKVPIFTELGNDYLAKGFSVVFFVNFRQTIDELKKRFPEFRIIDGQTPGRDDSLACFQANTIRGLIANCSAGGVSCDMHDLLGGYPRVGLVSLGLSAIEARQVFGRLHRDGGLSPALYRVVFANKTVETQIHKIVSPKLDNLDALNDADLDPGNLKIV
jgi:hypothetical protein